MGIVEENQIFFTAVTQIFSDSRLKYFCLLIRETGAE